MAMSAHESSSTGQAMMAFHDAYEQHEKDAVHEKLIQADTVSEQSMTATAKQSLLATKLMAPVINPQHNTTYAILDNGCTRSMGSWHAIQRFTQAIEPMKDLISYSSAETEFTFANGETAKVNWTLRLRYHTTPPCSTNIDILEQGTVPILLSVGQTRNLYMTIEHTLQCDKITCKAFGMNCQAVPVSGARHALVVDLAGVARVKSHGEIAIKGLANYVYDDDNSIQFPSREHSVSEQVCASRKPRRRKRQRLPKLLVLSSRITGYSTRRTSSSSVCASRLARHCSHRQEQRTGVSS